MPRIYKNRKQVGFITPPSVIQKKALIVHKHNDQFIYTDDGFVYAPRKNGRHYLRVNGEIIRASIVASPNVETWKRDPKAINDLFPSARGTIKLATLIATTIALCIFLVIAWLVTRVFGSV